MARKNNPVTTEKVKSKTPKTKAAAVVPGETHEELMKRVKGELVKTFLIAAVAMAVGILLEKFIRF